MRKGYLYIVLIFLICMLSISAISAADKSAKDIISTDNNEGSVLKQTANEDVSISINDKINENNNRNYDNYKLILESNSYEIDNEKSKLKEGETEPGSLSDLNTLINEEYSSNSTITLDRDYIGGSGNIKISRELTIDGQGHTLNGLNRTRILHITGDNVILKNINFKNGNDIKGGAIYWDGNNGTVIRCNFTKNFAENNGGAIHWEGEDGMVIESNFTENSAINGGAIAWYSYGKDIDGTVCNNSYFYKNYAKFDGGALYWSGNGSVSNNCTFSKNDAGNNGGAINWVYGTVTNKCKFNENTANSIGDDGIAKGGGAIFGRIGANVTNSCQFIGNKMYCDDSSERSKGGGAIFINDHGNISGCLFINNTSERHGGAILFNTEGINEDSANLINSSCENCIFINNTSSGGEQICICDYSDTIPKNFFFGGINNWFGNNESNYNVSFLGEGNTWDIWLFLNATAIPNPIPALNPSEIFFKLFAYNNSTKETYEIDNSLLPEVYLTSTAINGTLGNDSNKLGNSTIFTGSSIGTGSVTERMENIEQTIFFTIEQGNSNLEDSAEDIDYGENVTIELIYIEGATGTINITLIGENGYSERFENIPLNNTITLPVTLLPSGYHIVIDYSGDYNIKPATADSTMIVKKLNPNMDITPYNISVKDEDGVMFEISLHKNATGNLTINLTGQDPYTVDVVEAGRKDGENLIITLKNDKKTAGEYNLTATYHGDEIYENSSLEAVSIIERFHVEINEELSNITYGEDAVINISINATGTVIIYMGDEEFYPGELEDGKLSIIIPNLTVGEKIGEIVYYGDRNNTPCEKRIAFTVNKGLLKLNATDLTTIYAKEDYLVVSLKDPKDNGMSGTILSVELNGNTRNYTTEDGQIKIATKGLEKNTYDVIISYNGDENYSATSTTAKIIVEAANSSVKAENVSTTYGETINVPVISINATNVTYEILDKDGKKVKEGTIEANGKISDLDLAAGEYTVNLTTVVDKNHKSANSTSKITVNKALSVINTKDLNVNFGEPISIEITSENASEMTYQIKDKDNNSVANGTIQANEDIAVQDLAAGEYTVEISYPGNENYTSSNATAKLTVNKLDTELTADEITTTYNISKDLVITLKDSKGNPIGGASISVDLNGEKKYTTDSNGQIKVPTKGLAASTYTAKITFEATEIYSESSTTTEVTVNKDATEISATDLNATYKEEDYLVATLKDSEGNPLSGVELSVDLNGSKTFVTDSNGQIKIPTKDLEASKYAATISFDGNENYIESSANANVIVNRINTRFNFTNMTTTGIEQKVDGRAGKYFYFQLLDEYGNPLAGKRVSMGFNGVVYNRTTNETGWAKLQINLRCVNLYTFAVEFGGDDEYAGAFDVALINVTHQTPKLSASNKAYKSTAKTKTLTATLKSAKGNLVPGKKITFTVNGKKYTAKTNSKGVATVKVSLSKKGTYKFTASFAGDNTYKKISKTAKLTIK